MKLPEYMPRSLQDLVLLAESIAGISEEWRYEFMPEDQFMQLDPDAAARVYWREMIYRSEVVALASAFKAARWVEAVEESRSNYYSFTSSLRGAIESFADSVYTLKYVPLTLARDHCAISKQLRGRSLVLTTHGPLEERLLHFVQAKRFAPKVAIPDPEVHRARTVRQYLEAFDIEPVHRLYSYLCGVVHPAYEGLPDFVWVV